MAAVKKPGFNNAAGSRNRRTNRYVDGNQSDIRHKAVRGVTVAFVAPDQVTDSGTDFLKFNVGEFVDAQLSVAQDSTYEVATVIANQLDMVEQTITSEIAGPDILIISRNNRIDSRLA